MKVLTFAHHGSLSAGRLEGDQIVALPFDDVGALLAAAAHQGRDWRELAQVPGGATFEPEEVRIAPVVTNPSKSFCVGLNYMSHIEEMGRDTPTHPTLFAKFANAYIGANDDLVLPAVSERVDWEAELAIVIATPARNVSRGNAVPAIAGYTVSNDVTMRDWQRRTSQFLQGKTFEASSPIGPYLVSADELDDVMNLELSCKVDDEIMQHGSTSDLLFDQFELVEYTSTICTLEPGDIILTGTPGGVGDGRDPKVYLRPGQVLTTHVEGIGTLTNHCVAERGVE